MRETQEAERCRENLLKPQGQKRKIGASEAEDQEEAGRGSIGERRKKNLRKSAGKEQREKEIDAIYKNTALLVSYYPSGNSLHNYARGICHHRGEHISEPKLPE